MADTNTGGRVALSKRRFLWSLYITELLLVLIALVVARLSRGEFLPYNIRFDADSLMLGMVAAIPPAIIVMLLNWGPVSRLGRLQNSMDQILDKLRTPFGLAIRSLGYVDIVFLSLAAGIGEELFFRGLLQSYAGIWLSALIFGLLHALTPTYFFLATAIGLWLGMLYQTSENLLVPILCHATYDIFALILLQRQLSRQNTAES